MTKSRRLPPIHPGEILREDFMVPLGISMNKLALDLRVPVTRITEIVHERRGITPDTALRLGRYFNADRRGHRLHRRRIGRGEAEIGEKRQQPHRKGVASRFTSRPLRRRTQ